MCGAQEKKDFYMAGQTGGRQTGRYPRSPGLLTPIDTADTTACLPQEQWETCSQQYEEEESDSDSDSAALWCEKCQSFDAGDMYEGEQFCSKCDFVLVKKCQDNQPTKIPKKKVICQMN